jgi:hypothetical protein
MAMSGDTLGFLESSWNRGILSRMAMNPEMSPPTPPGIGGAEPCGLIAVTVRNPFIRHTSARSASRINVFRTISCGTNFADHGNPAGQTHMILNSFSASSHSFEKSMPLSMLGSIIRDPVDIRQT